MADSRTISGAPPRRTAVEEVYRSLKRDIITLQHRPGAALAEQTLADAYGTSRVPVREACRRLQQEGLLTAIPYKGYFVSPISPKEISDSFELRNAIETRAVALATTAPPMTNSNGSRSSRPSSTPTRTGLHMSSSSTRTSGFTSRWPRCHATTASSPC